MELFNMAPWHLNVPNSYNIYCYIPQITSHTDNVSLKTRVSTEQIDNNHTDYILYTDGLVTLQSKDGSLQL